MGNVIGNDAKTDLLKATDSDYKEALKSAFTSLMTCPKDKIKENLLTLQAKIQDRNSKSELDDLFLTLLSQYPGDVGCFVIYLVNYIKLNPGESLFLGPNIIHAYLEGDCIECMACSDNVVRAGLTPKLIDVDTLCSMLDYTSSSDVKFEPEKESEIVTLYIPPVKDFAVAKIQIRDSGKVEKIPKRSTPSIMIVIEGQGQFKGQGEEMDVKEGKVLFLVENQDFELSKTGDKDLVAYQAYSQ